jgi:hypothetical protein
MLIICRDTAFSDLSLKAICDAKSYLPTPTTVLQWLSEGGAWSEQYVHAKSAQTDFMAHQVVELSDSGKDPKTVKNQMEARMWYTSKLNPKKYGDKLELNGSIETPQRDIASLETALAISAVCKRIMEKAQLLEHKE